ncbi:hemolysin family protein [Chitinophaga horti]|uniref:Hemolysin family protein n=1 Tax=Chitinophaga horti TaxID=2920382 RepID=A0ABY6J6X5_9BACT|nr:hemolysin family protein [Chitinophaga horti]UYQ95383.1 hemolysin family protein [Chitinophaga horti]
MTWDILLTLFLVLLNGFFVAAEFAIVKVRTSQIEVNTGRSKAVSTVAKSIVNNLDGYLAATQLGITLASLGLGWVGEDVMTALIINLFEALGLKMEPAVAHRAALPVAFIVITILHIVFGELAPKSLAIRKPVPTTFAIALPLKVFFVIFRPFIWVLNGFANVILKAIGIKPAGEHGDIHSEEELRVIISESHQGGVIEETEKALIQNVFNLADRHVSSLMTPRNELVWLDVNDSPEENKKKVMELKHTVYPLAKDDIDNTFAFIYSKDLLSESLSERLGNLEALSKKLLVVTQYNRTYQVLELFQREKIYQAMVVDEFGTIKGLVTINDIVDALVGNISSETNEFEYEVVRNDDGSMLVDAQMPFVEFLELLHVDVDSQKTKLTQNYVTLGGFILDKLGKIPDIGDHVKLGGLQLQVMEMDQLRIAKVLVSGKIK